MSLLGAGGGAQERFDAGDPDALDELRICDECFEISAAEREAFVTVHAAPVGGWRLASRQEWERHLENEMQCLRTLRFIFADLRWVMSTDTANHLIYSDVNTVNHCVGSKYALC